MTVLNLKRNYGRMETKPLLCFQGLMGDAVEHFVTVFASSQCDALRLKQRTLSFNVREDNQV